jgi:hypothetical protein
MKRLRRWLFNFAAAVSFLLCVATTLLWVRSHGRPGWCQHIWPEDGITVGIFSIDGRIILAHDRGSGDFSATSPELFSHVMKIVGRPEPLGFKGAVAGFNIIIWEFRWARRSARSQFYAPLTQHTPPALSVQAGDRPEKTIYLVVPYWMPLMLTILLPGYWLIRFYRLSSRAHNGQCGVCGYDLRATPERCPECGTSTPAREFA